MKKQIPNLITLGNLTCGVIAILCAMQGRLMSGAIFILLGIFFDFFDGMTARLLNVTSELGKELDSLADVVTSGVAPAFLLYAIIQASPTSTELPWFPFIALLIPAFTAYRLGKFNLDERQHTSFLGLPAPSNAIIWVGIVLINHFEPTSWLFTASGLWLLVALSIATDVLLISEVPMFSLKVDFHNLSWKNNSTRYVFLIGCAILIFSLTYYSVSLIILWYIVLSLLTQKKATNHIDQCNPTKVE